MADSRSADGALDSDNVQWRKSQRRCVGIVRMLRALQGRAAPKTKKLSHGARLAALLVVNFDAAYFSVWRLADLLECAESTARGYLAELELAGVIRRHERFDGRGACITNIYELLIDVPPLFRDAPANDRGDKHRSTRSPKERKIRAAQEGTAQPRMPDQNPEAAAPKTGAPEQSRPSCVPPPNKRTEARLLPQDTPLELSGKSSDAKGTATRFTAPPAPRPNLDLRDCRSPLLSPELEVALRQLPEGAAGLRVLERRLAKGLPLEHAKLAAQRAVTYHADKGVDSAVRFLQHVLPDFARQEDRAKEQIESLQHDYVPEERKHGPPKKLPERKHVEPYRAPASPEYVQRFIEKSRQIRDVLERGNHGPVRQAF